MKTHVEFRSDAFPPYDDEEHEVNPGRYGKRLAEYLFSSLQEDGFEASSPIAEDWGWVIKVKNDLFALWVGCGNYEEYEDGFLCFIEPHEPFIRKWFKKIETKSVVESLQASIDRSLSNHKGVRGLKWWSYDEFNNPKGA